MRAVVDRFEEDYAVVLVEDKEERLDIPKRLLPPGTREGSWLKILLELDSDATKKQEEKVSNLIEKLKNKPR